MLVASLPRSGRSLLTARITAQAPKRPQPPLGVPDHRASWPPAPHEPVRQSGKSTGLYFKYRQLHFVVAVPSLRTDAHAPPAHRARGQGAADRLVRSRWQVRPAVPHPLSGNAPRASRSPPAAQPCAGPRAGGHLDRVTSGHEQLPGDRQQQPDHGM